MYELGLHKRKALFLERLKGGVSCVGTHRYAALAEKKALRPAVNKETGTPQG